ncbi:hypothetical protein KDA06_04625 [Candidatus Saccharibacteria bacterium]|jgi:hypothetical protein|nr:hypothetical protein [Candidatus Saccharibacteria bacterium]
MFKFNWWQPKTEFDPQDSVGPAWAQRHAYGLGESIAEVVPITTAPVPELSPSVSQSAGQVSDIDVLLGWLARQGNQRP